MVQAGSATEWGQVTVTPDRGHAGEWGTWTVRYTVGARPIVAGGAVLVQLPSRWHQWWRNSARRVQSVDPGLPFYVSARASQPAVTVRCTVQAETESEYVKTGRIALDGRTDRYAWVVQVDVVAGELAPGDWLEVIYGDQREGSRGFTPPLWVGSSERVQVAVLPGQGEEAGTPQLLPEAVLPWLHADPDEPVELVVTVPSVLVTAERAEVNIVALDQFHNGVPLPDLDVRLAVHEGAAEVPQTSVPLGDTATLGAVRVPFTPTQPGTLRLRATSVGGRLYGISNPARVGTTAPAHRLYWGDLHSHSHFSHDGTGAGDDHFRYARHVAALDVYGNADHGESLTEADWAAVQQMNAEHDEPGRFVTLVGYEDSLRYPYGHHNVFFRGASGPLLHARNSTLEQVWARSTPGEVVTIPHHTGGFGRPGAGVKIDWSRRDGRFRRLQEIYSSHGLSEAYNPDHSLSMEVVDFTFQGPADPGSYAQDGWLAGERTGVIASSDNHGSQPGKEGFGIIAVLAPELTREAIFDALLARRTYGTTGSRILLDFRVAGALMGSEVELAADAPVHVAAWVVGTGPLRTVEVLRGDLVTKTWTVAHRDWFPGNAAPLEHTVEWTDPQPPAEALYYLRVRQRDYVHGRIVMAWSSPVWVKAP